MKINTKVRYGLRTMLEIAQHKGKTGVLQKTIAENQDISEKYLDHIISDLKRAGLIINIGGKKSGYVLNKPKSKITVYDIYRAFESDLSVIACIDKPKLCKKSPECISRIFWAGLNEEMVRYMKKVTLSEMLKHSAEIEE